MIRAFLLSLALCFTSFASDQADWQTLTPADLSVRLTDQNGKSVEFYDGLIKGKTVVINFVFTNCNQACPMLTAQFRALERKTTELGLDGVSFVSVSIDPERDDVGALARFAEKLHADWTFLTGGESDIRKLLDAFHLPLRDRDNHTSRFVISNGTTGRWTSVDGFTRASSIAQLIQEAQALSR